MGVNVNIFGYIDCPGRFWMPYSQQVFRHNKRVINRLPLSSPEPPYITKDMFSMMRLCTDEDFGKPQYESHLIHFAGSYKNMYQIEADWLAKFESVLAQLCWTSAVAINNFSYDQCRWEVDHHMVNNLYMNDPPQPPRQWSFVYNHLENQDTSEQGAIGSHFSSPYHIPKKPAI